ncbi:MAG: hypothetical protein WBH04_09935, partial [Albidovulum sp.]
MKLWAKAGLILLALCCKAQAAQPCEIVMFEDQNYSICSARAGDDLRLFLNGADDVPLGSFGAVNQVLADEQRQLAFAMNAGMYHANRKPVGLY